MNRLPISRNKMPDPTEHMIQNQIIHYLKYSQYFVMRLNSGKYSVGEGRNKRFIMGQDAGTPDIYALKDGQSYFLEIKRSKKHKATELQKAKMAEIESYGGACYVVSSIEDVQEYGL